MDLDLSQIFWHRIYRNLIQLLLEKALSVPSATKGIFSCVQRHM